MPADSIREVNVFKLMPSPINHQVKTAYELIPSAKPKNLPGQRRPSKCSYANLVPYIKAYDIVEPPTRDKIKGLFTNHFQRNWPLV